MATRHYRVIDGHPYARFVYTDDSGKRKEKHMKADSKTHAKELYERMKREFGEHNERILDAQRMEFQDLVDYYSKTHLVRAEYVDGRKVSGRRSLKGLSSQLDALRQTFGRKRLRSITYGDIVAYRSRRLKTATIRN